MTTGSSLLSALTLALVTLAATSPARAQLEPSPTEATAMGGLELNSVLLAPGRVDVRMPLAIGMNSGAGGKPLSIPADIYYGLSDNLTIGLSHSEGVVQAVSAYRAGHGVCLSGTDSGCLKSYDNVGLDALFGLMKGAMQLAFHGGLDFRSLDPAWLAARVGVLLQAPLAANLAVLTDPRLGIGLTKRDVGNKESLSLPLAVQFWASPTFRVAARTGIAGPLDGFGDAYRGALGIFAGFGFNELLEAFASFDLDNLYGKNGSADFRTLTVGVNLHM